MEIELLCLAFLMQAFLLLLGYHQRSFFLFFFAALLGLINSFILISDNMIIQYASSGAILEIRAHSLFIAVPLVMMTIGIYGANSMKGEINNGKEPV